MMMALQRYDAFHVRLVYDDIPFTPHASVPARSDFRELQSHTHDYRRRIAWNADPTTFMVQTKIDKTCPTYAQKCTDYWKVLSKHERRERTKQMPPTPPARNDLSGPGCFADCSDDIFCYGACTICPQQPRKRQAIRP
jgi:hypothetical protein